MNLRYQSHRNSRSLPMKYLQLLFVLQGEDLLAKQNTRIIYFLPIILNQMGANNSILSFFFRPDGSRRFWQDWRIVFSLHLDLSVNLTVLIDNLQIDF